MNETRRSFIARTAHAAFAALAGGAVALTAGLPADAGAAPLAYQYTQLTPATVRGEAPAWGPPALSSRGAVAVTATFASGKSEVLRFAGGRQLVVASARRFERFGDLSVNARGQVAFEASPSNVTGEGIFRRDAAGIVQIAGTRDAGDFDFVNAGPQVNAAGQVAFIGERIVAGRFVDGVYAGGATPVAAVYDVDGPFDDFTGNPSLNDSGAVAFLATLDSGVGGLFLGSGGADFVTVADDRGTFTSVFSFSDPSLNERGEVAFRAGTNADPDDNSGSTGEGIFLYTQRSLRTVWQSSVSDGGSAGDPSLNNLGQVAFIVELTFGQPQLVTGPDLVNDRVVGTGDALLGRVVSGLVFGREGLNDDGALAFVATFTDGSSAVVLATPPAAASTASSGSR